MPLHPMSPPLVKRMHNVWEFATEERARRSSYKEAARLQGFAPGMAFPDTSAGSLDMRYKVVGNAVPPPLFEAVARASPQCLGLGQRHRDRLLDEGFDQGAGCSQLLDLRQANNAESIYIDRITQVRRCCQLIFPSTSSVRSRGMK